MSDNVSVRYGIKLAIVYAMVWFVDLLDSTSLNVAITSIATYFEVAPSSTEWVVIGFFLAMTVGISISGWLGDTYTMRRVFLLSQILYILSSAACACAPSLHLLIAFRAVQGFAGGLAIPLGMAALLQVMPKTLWAKTTANINMITLLAPALGPLYGVYVTEWLDWRAIFYIKLPLMILTLALSVIWLRKEQSIPRGRFDWSGFTVGATSLLAILWVFSEVGKGHGSISLALIFAVACYLGLLFIRIEQKKEAPLIPLEIFRIRRFTLGNVVQSSANAIFLGANFMIALYLQDGLKLPLVETGWVMACISPGMIIAQPLIGRFYNRVGAIPYMITGLLILSSCMLSLMLMDAATPHYLIGLNIFLIGCASSLTQSSNVVSIFASLPNAYKGSGSSLYTVFKQLSASFGVAFSAMVFSLAGGSFAGLFSYHFCFAALATLPMLGLVCTLLIREKQVSEG